jgi:4-hydroxybenzoate polyprenyltransferase
MSGGGASDPPLRHDSPVARGGSIGEGDALLLDPDASRREAERAAEGMPPPEPRAPRRPLALLLLEAMRPKQWIKNSFVFAGLVFAGRVLDAGDVARAVTVAFAFCLASGATYLLNDARDAEADRRNPRTAGRPIARGDLSERTALVSAAVAAALALGLAAVVNWESLAALGGYVVLQLAYSHGLKHILFLDVMAIAAGFVLRAAAGGLAIDVPISSWLLLCTGLLAIFLGFTKRRGEAVALGGSAQPSRAVLDLYSVGLLDELIAVVTPATVVVYSIYAVTGAHTHAMLLTVPFVMYGIFRVLFLIHHHSAMTEEPAVVVYRDRPLLACVLLWAVCAAAIAAINAAA